MSTLVWGIKASLLAYVRGMPDGRVEVTDGATTTPEGFAFPGRHGADGELFFTGTVTLVGHGGMMHVAIADPCLARTPSGWRLTIRDDEDPTGRMRFATLDALAPDGGSGRAASGTRLTQDGADLFFGPYVEGTPLDDPRVTP